MALPELTKLQLSIIEQPLDSKIFLEGRAGSGKTTCGVERMLYLMKSGVPGNSILIFLPLRTLGQPYMDAIQTPGVIAGGMVSLLTLGGLTRRMVELFWSSIAEKAGFAHPDDPPIFLTHETAQYFMSKIVNPLFQEGYFDTITISRNRIYSQILENLNKAAVIGFPHTQIAERLINAWNGELGQISVYQDAQDCANHFREYCLANNLVDFSLQIETFSRFVFTDELAREHLDRTYTHIIADNIEEDTPISHDLLRELIPGCQSCLLIYDRDAGYRRFLGADPISANQLKASCDELISLDDSFVTPLDLDNFRSYLGKQLQQDVEIIEITDTDQAVDLIYERFFPEMLDKVSEKIVDLIFTQDVPPGEIAVLAPLLSDALRFSLTNRLQAFNIPVRTHRPSRSLREEPAAQCLLTLAALAHPLWNIYPSYQDVANALLQAIDGIDPTRAYLLTQITYQGKEPYEKLSSFTQIIPESQERITYLIGERFEKLRLWLLEYSQQNRGDLDYFIKSLFEEILSQPGYTFHLSYDAGETTTDLIDSVKNFMQAVGNRLTVLGSSSGKEYFEMFREGVIASQYLESWQLRPANAVLIVPAYTFLLSNQPIDIQFWLDIANQAWNERLHQPITHPYVLSRQWNNSAKWTDQNEVETNITALYRLTSGLISRCRKKIYLGLSEFNEQGFEQRGLLLRALQRIFLETNKF
jgi:hypothetical protein